MGSGSSMEAGPSGEGGAMPAGYRAEGGPPGGRAEVGSMPGPSGASFASEEATVTFKTVRRPGIATRNSNNQRDKMMRRAGKMQSANNTKN